MAASLLWAIIYEQNKTLSFLWEMELLFALSPNWLYLGLPIIAIARNSLVLRATAKFFRQQSWNVICCPSGHCFDDFYINECSVIFCPVLPSIYIFWQSGGLSWNFRQSFCLLGKLYISLWLECGFQDSRRWVSSFSIFNAV